jgi:hypothetical protein
MSDIDGNNEDRIRKMFDDLDAVAQRLSAEDMAERSGDQPSGETARLSAQYYVLGGAGGVVIENLRDLYDEGTCETCLVPLGQRTKAPMRVFFRDGQSRRYDGLLARIDERPLHPTYCLYADRFLEWLLPAEREPLKWREVEVLNPTKITRRIFELLPAHVHAAVATLRGGKADVSVCRSCGRASDARYPLAGSLPDWLNPKGSTRYRGQPTEYLVEQSLPEPPPPSFTYGNPVFGVSLVVTTPITPQRRKRMRAVGSWPVGVVDSHLTMRKPS